MTQKVLLLGARGQLGQELARTAAPDCELRACARDELDIADAAAVGAALADFAPDLVLNAAAYTAVDNAESEVAAAARGNAQGPGVLAGACADSGARFIHVSTDFVFDGAASVPYAPDAATGPIGEYGRSKLAGELAVREALSEAVILRTGWVYSSFGNNFVKTMLRLMAERDQLTVVADQVGTPTWAHGLAQAVWAAADKNVSGVYHWSDAGVCSWYDFAVAINEEAVALGLLNKLIDVRPIPAAEYPTPAQRPAYSVLDKSSSWQDFELEGIHWRTQLRAMLKDLKELENV